MQRWGHVPQPSPHITRLGTSQRCTGRETWESEGPWRAEPLQSLRHMAAGGREDTSHPCQPAMVLGACPEQPWQSGVPGHSWAALVLPSPLGGASLPPLCLTAGRAASTRCQLQSRAQAQLMRGWSHSWPCPGEPCVTQGHPGEPSEVPRSGPAGHGAGHLPGALMCSLWQPALP